MKIKEARPLLEIPDSNFEKAIKAVALLGLVATLAVTAYYWPKLPQQAPHHFGASGRPDAWGHKGLVLILPGISTVLYFILSWQAKRPHRFNYPWLITPENARAQYRWARRSYR